jgi:FAD:protein FMN transferase
MSDEHIIGVDCFGARCTIAVARSEPSVGAAVGAAQFLLECHSRLSRFLPDSELSSLNRDPRQTVPVSPLMRDFTIAARRAAELSGGLVDPTILPALRKAGYTASMRGSTPHATPHAPPEVRRAGRPDPAAPWAEIEIDPVACTITRPPGLEIDSGGVAKGWAADRAGRMLASHPTYAVECAGDLRVGGTARVPREVLIADPAVDGGDPLATVSIVSGGVATSGIGKRSWIGPEGELFHHLIDPGSGEPSFSGVVQATALAPTGEEAEMRAKCAVLAGPDAAADWLPHGGFVLLDDRTVIDRLPRSPEADPAGDAEEVPV